MFFAHLTDFSRSGFLTKYSEFDNFDFVNCDMLFQADVAILTTGASCILFAYFSHVLPFQHSFHFLLQW